MNIAASCSNTTTEHVPIYMKLKRTRAFDAGKDDSEDLFPPSVKLRWDQAEMGEAPFALGTTAAHGNKAHEQQPTLHFRRLADGSLQPSNDLTNGDRRRRTVMDARKRVEALGSSVHVTGVKRLRDGVIVIECEESPAAHQLEDLGASSSPPPSVPLSNLQEIYVVRGQPLRPPGAMKTEDLNADDEFSFDGLTIDDTCPPRFLQVPEMACTVRTAPFCGDRGTAEDDAPTLTLRPRKLARTELQTSTAWGEVAEAPEVGLADWLLEVAPLLALSDDVAREEAQAELYCYPDHRHDDEYDSNAEDFSGNDYPDEEDLGALCERFMEEHDRDSPCSRSTSHGDRDDHDGSGRYGFYQEDDYHERSLGPGWGSDEDEAGGGGDW